MISHLKYSLKKIHVLGTVGCTLSKAALSEVE